MGLDLVEIVYRIEDEFKITVPNEISETLVTPRMVIDYLMSLPKICEKRSRDYVSTKVWLIIEEQLGIKRKDFNYNDDSRFIEDMEMD